MASLSQAKILGGVGSILVLLGGLGSFAIPYLGTVLPIVGLIMTFIAVKYISDIVQDSSIFKNIIIGLVAAIVGTVVLGVFVIEALIKNFGSLTGITNITQTTTIGTNAPPSLPPGLLGFVEIVLVGFAVLWILLIVSAIFVRRSYNGVSARLNVGLFRTAALLYLIGAILTIIFIGLIIVLVAQILLIIAYFSIPDTVMGYAQPTTTFYPPPPTGQPVAGAPTNQPTSSIPGGRCPRCGAPISQDSIFCPSCGSRLSQ